MEKERDVNMDYNEIVEQYIPNFKELLTFGFQKQKESYIFRKLLNEELYMEILISEKEFIVNVYEIADNEKYLPFYRKEGTGSYISEIKEKVEEEIETIKRNCFHCTDLRKQVLNYIKETYQTVPEYSWPDTPSACSLKTNMKHKWYGIMMNIPYKTLGIEKDGNVDIINVKNNPDKVESMIDHQNYFPAYHMNKKYWVTILLNNNIDIKEIIKRIDESYNIVDNLK